MLLNIRYAVEEYERLHENGLKIVIVGDHGYLPIPKHFSKLSVDDTVLCHHGRVAEGIEIEGCYSLKQDGDIYSVAKGFNILGKKDNYFETLPKFLQETAFIDRIHGLLPGWELPRIEKKMIGNGLALKADYFSSVLHALRTRGEFSSYFREHTYTNGDIRDIKAVERLCSGFLKLLFPDLNLLNKEKFNEYCLVPAKQLRSIIRQQLSIRDHEYKSRLAEIEAK